MFEEVVAFVIHQYECGEVLHLNFPYCLHAEFGVFHALNRLDVLLCQDGRRTANRAEVEATVLLAGIGHIYRAVALCQHDERAAVVLELVYVRVHTASGRWSHRAARHAGRGLGGACIVDRVILQVFGHRLAGVEAGLNLCVRNVASYNDGAVQREACANRVLRQYIAYIPHGLVEVDAHGIAFACLPKLGGNQTARVVVHALNPDTVFVYLALDVTVGGAAYAQSDGAACAVAGQTHHANVVCHIFAAELSAQAYLVGLLQQLFLQFYIAEGTPGLVARGRQVVVVVGRGQLDGEQVLLSARAANHKGDMVGWASRSTEALHLLHKERNEGAGVLYAGLGLLVEIGLVGRAAAFGHAQETVLHAFGGLNVYLCGQVALGVHLLVHRERRVL